MFKLDALKCIKQRLDALGGIQQFFMRKGVWF
jgi:hypothetical protein